VDEFFVHGHQYIFPKGLSVRITAFQAAKSCNSAHKVTPLKNRFNPC